MTNSQKLQSELNAFNAKREEVKKQNTVSDGFPKISRNHSYRKSISIRSL